MSLRKYSEKAFAISEGFRRALSIEESDLLRQDMQALGEVGWYEWVAENEESIFSLLSDSPSRIAKRSDWKDSQTRHRLALAAYRASRLGGLALLLSEELLPGGGYRETCAQAARAGHVMEISARWFWPFEGPPPFDNWEPPGDLDHFVSFSGRAL
jgi:hypothetical protein